jgi:hypothetical protein
MPTLQQENAETEPYTDKKDEQYVTSPIKLFEGVLNWIHNFAVHYISTHGEMSCLKSSLHLTVSCGRAPLLSAVAQTNGFTNMGLTVRSSPRIYPGLALEKSRPWDKEVQFSMQ